LARARRSQPRTVVAGRSTASATRRCPSPPAAASRAVRPFEQCQGIAGTGGLTVRHGSHDRTGIGSVGAGERRRGRRAGPAGGRGPTVRARHRRTGRPAARRRAGRRWRRDRWSTARGSIHAMVPPTAVVGGGRVGVARCPTRCRRASPFAGDADLAGDNVRIRHPHRGCRQRAPTSPSNLALNTNDFGGRGRPLIRAVAPRRRGRSGAAASCRGGPGRTAGTGSTRGCGTGPLSSR
jgi:hypothetical protein